MLEDIYMAERSRLAALAEQADDGDYLHPVFGEGKSNHPLIMFIGEAPGREEAVSGRPFVGKAGKQLDSMLANAGIDRSHVFVSNAVKFRPIKRGENAVSNRTPTVREIDAALEVLNVEICTVAPRVIATLGNVPLSAVLKIAGEDKLTVGEIHGMPRPIAVAGRGFMLFPLYHPAASIYNRELKPTLKNDLISLGRFAKQI